MLSTAGWNAGLSPAVASALDRGALPAVAAARAIMVIDPARSLAIARRLEKDVADPLVIAQARWLEGDALLRMGRVDPAAAVLKTALATTLHLAPNTALHGQILLSQGLIAEGNNRIGDAFSNYQRAFWILRHVSDKHGEAKALQYIAGLYSSAGDNARALRYYSEANDVYHDDPSLLIAGHNNVGEALRALGRYRGAEREYAAALALARKQSAPGLQANILTNLAWTKVATGELDAAAADANRALALSNLPDAAEERPFAYGVLGLVAEKRGDLQTAAALMDRTFQGADLKNTPLPFMLFHKDAAAIYDRIGRPELAYRHVLAFKRLDDGQRALASSTNAALMAAQFDFSNQNLKITQLQANRARLHEILLGLALTAVALVTASMAFGLFTLRRSRNRERAANTELSRVNGNLEDALRVKSEFLAMTSHEIRTPLNGILGMTQVLLADRTTTSPIRSKLGVIHSAGETMRALVDDILDLAKMEAGKLSVSRAGVRVRDLLDEIACLWRPRAEAKGLSLSLDLGDCPPLIEEDGARLRQVVMNLLANAVKFTETGRIAVTVRVQGQEDGEALVIAIADTGIGIPAEQHERVFEKFVQADASTSRRYGGTGLGLSICRSVVEALDGRIEVVSTPGKGSCFTVILPLRRLAREEPTIPAHATQAADGSILLLEPNPLHRKMIAKALGTRFGVIVQAGTIEAALASLADTPVRYAIIQASLPEPDRTAAVKQIVDAVAADGGTALVIASIDDGIEPSAVSSALLLAKPVAAADIVATLRTLQDEPTAQAA
jgi:signal transduction histidine kinase/ActR/RegA family two-component response regulator